MPEARGKAAAGLTLGQAAERAVQAAMKAGAAQADALLESARLFRVDTHQGEIENLKQSDTRGLGLRVFVNHRTALVYTSDLRPAALVDLAAHAVALAKQSAVDPGAGLPDTPPSANGTSESLELFDPAIVALPIEQKINMCKTMEQAALGADKRILRTDGCSVTTSIGDTYLASSAGATLNYKGTSVSAFVNPLADDGPRQQNGAYGQSMRTLAALRAPEDIGKEATRRAVSRVGAKSVPAARVPVVLHPDIASNWLQNLHGSFTGDQVFKKTTFLVDKLQQRIGSDLVTMVDDGALPKGEATAPFDGEGVPTRRNVLIDKGTLSSFVWNAYWARRAGTKSTGSAARGYQGAPGIGPHNLYFAAGTSSLEDILKSIDRGFYMVDQGAFGYNPTTGSYSYAAAGFWIEKGEIAFPVTEITCASTSLDMLAGVVMVGNDLVFDGAVCSPTLKIQEMTISGKAATG